MHLYIIFKNCMRSCLNIFTDDYNVRGSLGYWDSFENTRFMFINCSIYSFICGVNVRLVINFFEDTSCSLIFFYLIVNWNLTLISVVVVLHANCCCILRPLYMQFNFWIGVLQCTMKNNTLWKKLFKKS